MRGGETRQGGRQEVSRWMPHGSSLGWTWAMGGDSPGGQLVADEKEVRWLPGSRSGWWIGWLSLPLTGMWSPVERSLVGKPRLRAEVPEPHCNHILLVRVRLRPAQIQCGWGLPEGVNTGMYESWEPMGNNLPPHRSKRQEGRGRTRPKARETCHPGLWPLIRILWSPTLNSSGSEMNQITWLGPGHMTTLICKGVWETECFHLSILPVLQC